MREENLLQGLEGICAACKTEQKIEFQEEWFLNSLYRTGCCPGCSYDHWIFIRKI